MKTALLAFVALIVAGCATSTPSSPTNGWDAQDCTLHWCVREANGDAAQRMLSLYGLHQLDFKSTASLGEPKLGTDSVYWQMPFSEDANDIIGYNFAQRRPVAVNEDAGFATREEVHGPQMVYALRPSGNAGGRVLTMWDQRNGTAWSLNTGLAGEPLPYGFDGAWVLFGVTETDNANAGLWVYNYRTHEKEHVYTPLPTGQFENGTYDTLTDAAVARGHAYVAVDYVNYHGQPDNLSAHEGGNTIYDWDLGNHTHSVLHHFDGYSVTELKAGDKYVVCGLGKDGTNFMVDAILRNDGNQDLQVSPRTGDYVQPRTAGDWVAYVGLGQENHSVVAIHLPDLRQRVILPSNSGLTPGTMDFDGSRLVFNAVGTNLTLYPTTPEGSISQNAFWLDFDSR